MVKKEGNESFRRKSTFYGPYKDEISRMARGHSIQCDIIETIGKKFKRIIFASVVIFGLAGSGIALYKCMMEYVSYEVNTERKINEVAQQNFPRVMLCLNSMHSKTNFKRHYPMLEKILGLLYYNIELQEEMLEAVKTDLMTEHEHRKIYEDVISVEDMLRTTTMWELVTKTSSQFKVSACRAGSVDCSKGWRDDYYEQGRCKSYTGIGSTAKTLDIITIYNKSDWSVGWKNFYDGFTLYYTDDQSESVTRSKSLQINPKNAAILELSRANFVRLGSPYSDCIQNGTLKYRRNSYSYESCVQECKVEKILEKCGCRATFFRHYEQLFRYPDCMIFDHIFCVKEILQKFDSTLRFDCNCTATCDFSELTMSSVQYGYPSLTIKAPEDISINSVFIEMNSRVETTDEKPRYPFERFMSDVGGSIAFFLGFSAPTIIIFLEKLMINTMSTFQGRIARLSLNFQLSAVRTPVPPRRNAEFEQKMDSCESLDRGDKLEKLNNVLSCSKRNLPALEMNKDSEC